MGHFEGARDAQRVAAALPVGAEQLDLQPLGRQRRAIDHDERPVGPLGALVDQPRHGFLAGAGRAGDQHAAAGRRHPLDLGADAGGRARRADEGHLASGTAAQAGILALQAIGLDGAIDHQQQAVGLERLFDEVVGAGLDRRHGRVDRAVAADHHHRNRRILAPDHVEELQAVELAALQPDVEDHQRRPALAHGVDRLGAVVGAAGGVALILQDARDQRADVAFVVDDENVVAHDSSNCPRCAQRIIVRLSHVVEPTRFPSRRAGIPD